MGPGRLSLDAVNMAIAEFDELGRDAFLEKYGYGPATLYALDANGREYDPKAIAGVAYGFDHPDEGPLKPGDFSGGIALRSAFSATPYQLFHKRPPGTPPLRELLEEFMESYPRARSERFSGHPIRALVRNITGAFEKSGPVDSRKELKVDASIGQGNWAAVPWVAFLDKRITQTTQRGIYAVLLFREDMSGVYMTVAQGITELRQQHGRRTARQILSQNAEIIRRNDLSTLENAGFSIEGFPDLGNGGMARGYAESTVAYKLYSKGQVPDDQTILDDLEGALYLVEMTLGRRGAISAEKPQSPSSIFPQAVAAFRDCLAGAGFREPSEPVTRSTAFLSALVSKPFVILTGMSGSGKTQLAMRLGEWCGRTSSGRPRFLSVPVRPDWTGPEALFGYEDALRPLDQLGRPAWFVPRTLEFLLSAATEPDMPYVLLLDEMNLAHVERYFSDYLSGVESRGQVLPNLVVEDAVWRPLADGPSHIPLPRNVFVVGTVNVDETTYQFSPKVLDRATTFEIRTHTDELIDTATRPQPISPGPTEYLKCLVELAINDGWQAESPVRAPIGNHLQILHQLLSESGDEFGHRLYYEGIRFAAALELAGVSDVMATLDQIVLLKILPRIHGSRRKAEPVLQRLAAFSVDPQSVSAFSNTMLETSARLPRSMAKIRRMIRSAEVHQFASFTD